MPPFSPSSRTATGILIGSEVLLAEIARTPDLLRRQASLAVVGLARILVPANDRVEALTDRFAELGLHRMDAAEVASAVAGEADVFLTVDDNLLRKGRRFRHETGIRIESPVIWLLEATGGNR